MQRPFSRGSSSSSSPPRPPSRGFVGVPSPNPFPGPFRGPVTGSPEESASNRATSRLRRTGYPMPGVVNGFYTSQLRTESQTNASDVSTNLPIYCPRRSGLRLLAQTSRRSRQNARGGGNGRSGRVGGSNRVRGIHVNGALIEPMPDDDE